MAEDMTLDRDFDVQLRLCVQSSMTNDELEEQADLLLEAVQAHAADIALGSCVSVNFADGTIELGFTVVTDTLAGVHEQIAAVSRALEEHLAVKLLERDSQSEVVAV